MRKIFFLTIVFILLTLPFWGWILWKLDNPKKMNVLVIDKTVLNLPAQEHISFFWILNNEKYVKWDDKLYDPEFNYLGFYPRHNKEYFLNGLERRNNKTIDSISSRLDVLYYTDTYGIYYNDWYDKDVRNKSQKLYGGLGQKDIALIKKATEKNKLVISEFNCIGSPTNVNIRLQFEDLYKIKWTGWIGRFFDELDTSKNYELPRWFIKNYETQYNKWDFSGYGIIFVHESGSVAVLEGRRHLSTAIPFIRTQKINQSLFGIPEIINYPFWFEINQSSRKNNIISTFNINSNSAGDSILIKNNILKVFPAVVERNINNAKLYYFAADFADNPINYNYSKLKYVDKVKQITVNNKSQVNRTNFFYLYYLPLMRKILEDRYQITKNAKKYPISYF